MAVLAYELGAVRWRRWHTISYFCPWLHNGIVALPGMRSAFGWVDRTLGSRPVPLEPLP